MYRVSSASRTASLVWDGLSCRLDLFGSKGSASIGDFECGVVLRKVLGGDPFGSGSRPLRQMLTGGGSVGGGGIRLLASVINV